jgi:hypothetical protein
MVGERSGPLAGTFRRPWVGATEGSIAAMDLSKVGRGGLARAIIELTAGTTPVGDALHYLAPQS